MNNINDKNQLETFFCFKKCLSLVIVITKWWGFSAMKVHIQTKKIKSSLEARQMNFNGFFKENSSMLLFIQLTVGKVKIKV
jgi:hypothetical protein